MRRLIVPAVLLLLLAMLQAQLWLGRGSLTDLSEQRGKLAVQLESCLLYTSPSPRDLSTSRMPSSA